MLVLCQTSKSVPSPREEDKQTPKCRGLCTGVVWKVWASASCALGTLPALCARAASLCPTTPSIAPLCRHKDGESCLQIIRILSVVCSLYSQLSGKRDEKLLQNLFVTLKLYRQVPPYMAPSVLRGWERCAAMGHISSAGMVFPWSSSLLIPALSQ